MSLLVTINDDIKTAMRSKNSLTLGVLRMLKAAITNSAIEKKVAELADPDIVIAVRKAIKTRQDSIEAYMKAERKDLADIENEEISILTKFLPAAMSDDDINKLVDEAILASGATTKKQMGAAMKIATEKAAGRIDGKTLSSKIGSKLA